MSKIQISCALCSALVLAINPLREEAGYCLACQELLAWDQVQTVRSQGTKMVVNAVPTNGYGIRQATVWTNTVLPDLSALDGHWANIRAFKPQEELQFLAIAGKLSWQDGILQFEAVTPGDYDEQRLIAHQRKLSRPTATEVASKVLPKHPQVLVEAPVVLSVEEVLEVA